MSIVLLNASLGAFVALALASGWIFGYLLVREMRGSSAPSPKAFVFSFLGVFLPAVFAVVLANPEQRAHLLSQLGLSGARSIYFVHAILVPLLVIGVGHFGRALFQRQPLSQLLPPAGALKQMIPLFFVFLIWGFLEELGWRGFFAERLSSTLGPAGTAVVTGVFWSLWHLPQMLFSEQFRRSMDGRRLLGTILWGVQCALYGVMLAWLQFQSGSFLIPTVAHALINIVANISEVGLGVRKNPLWDGPSGAIAVAFALLLNISLFAVA